MLDAYRATPLTTTLRRQRATLLRTAIAAILRRLTPRLPRHPDVPPAAAHG